MAEAARRAAAKQLAWDLLDDVEDGGRPITDCLLRAKRLALMLGDSDAGVWLDLELRGYPKDFHFGRLGHCQKYARQGGRINEEDRYWTQSLPAIAAEMKAHEIQLGTLRFPSNVAPSISDANPNAMTGLSLQNAITKIVDGFGRQVTTARDGYIKSQGLYSGLRAAVHNWATDHYIALSFGSAAEEAFDGMRRLVDNFVADVAPKAAEQLAAVESRIAEGEAESFAQGLTSCRRVLQTVADVVFPPQNTPYTDAKGKQRKVGTEQYKNRLLAYLGDRIASGTDLAVITAELEHLANRLDTVYDKTCQGVHADVTEHEARFAMLHTYLILAEVARVSERA